MDPQINQVSTPPVVSTPVVSAPIVTQITPPVPDVPVPNKKKKWIIIVVLVLFFFLISSLSFVGYLLAYEKISLTKYPKFQSGISTFVMNIPFTPKTPRYVILKSASVQDSLKDLTFDASVAVDTNTSSTILPIPGLTNKIDLNAKGYANYENPKNFIFSLNATITKDVNIDLTKIGDNFYFRINKLEGGLRTYIDGLKKVNYAFLGQWYLYNNAGLQTDARKNLEEKSDEKSLVKESLDKTTKLLSDEKILKAIKINTEKLGDNKVYKLNLKVDPDTLDRIPGILAPETTKTTVSYSRPKLSENIKNLNIAVWIDMKSYYLRKIDTQFEYVTPQYNSYQNFTPSLGTENKIGFSLSSTFSDFNKKQNITTPQDPLPYTELIKQITGVDTGEQLAKANNTARINDINTILNAIHQYASDKRGVLPTGMPAVGVTKEIATSGANICSSLVPNYVSLLMVDPEIDNGSGKGQAISDCSKSYKTGYFVTTGTNGKVTIEALGAEEVNGVKPSIKVTR